MVSGAALRFGELESGSRVALHLPKDERYLALVLALIRAGHVACPVSDRLPPRGVAQLLGKAACSALISEDEQLLQAAGADLHELKPEALLEVVQHRTEPTDIPLQRSATIIFTSGSTGVPKAALTPSATTTTTRSARTPTSRSGPATGGSIRCRCITSGGFPYYSGACSRGRRSRSRRPELHSASPSPASAPRTSRSSLHSSSRLLREDADLGGLEAVLMGGGPVPPSLVDEALARGLPLHTSYGLTEMASQVTTTPPGASLEELRTAGRVLPDREVSIS